MSKSFFVVEEVKVNPGPTRYLGLVIKDEQRVGEGRVANLLWTNSIHEAFHFARRADAVGFALLFRQWCAVANVVEHAWMDVRPSDDAKSIAETGIWRHEEYSEVILALADIIRDQGIDHEDETCPMDSTCECANVARVNRVLGSADARRVFERWRPMTGVTALVESPATQAPEAGTGSAS